MKKIVFILILAFGLPYLSYSQPVVFNWARQMAGKNFYDGSLGIAKDAAGNIYLTGEFSGSRDFGGITLTAMGFSEIFVARYSPTGTCDCR